MEKTRTLTEPELRVALQRHFRRFVRGVAVSHDRNGRVVVRVDFDNEPEPANTYKGSYRANHSFTARSALAD